MAAMKTCAPKKAALPTSVTAVVTGAATWVREMVELAGVEPASELYQSLPLRAYSNFAQLASVRTLDRPDVGDLRLRGYFGDR